MSEDGMKATGVDKVTRQGIILTLISERELGTQQGVVEALAEEGSRSGRRP